MRGFPDWRDSSAYPTGQTYRRAPATSPDSDGHSDERTELPVNGESHLWAWQFLRRNPEYQAAWNAHRSGLGYDIAKQFGLSMLIAYQREVPDMIPFEASMRTLAFSRAKTNLPSLEEHEIAFILDDRIPLSEHRRFISEQYRRIVAARIARDKRLGIPSLRAQSSNRKNPTALSRYLRVLDAKNQGVQNKEIAAHFLTEGTYPESDAYKLYPGQPRIEKDSQMARRLMSEDYLSIAYS